MFRPGQEEALCFAYRGAPVSVVVLPTSAGKTAIMFAGPSVATTGVTLVVVPFACLLEEMASRARAVGICVVTSQELADGSRRFHMQSTRIVVTTPEALDVSSSELHTVLRTLEDEDLLDRVVFDECHNIPEALLTRWRPAFYKTLHGRVRVPQWLFLTATLPPSLEHRFLDSVLLARDGCAEPVEATCRALAARPPPTCQPAHPDVFRRPSHRPDLSYRVARYSRDDSIADRVRDVLAARDAPTAHLPRPRKVLVLLTISLEAAVAVASSFGQELICSAKHYADDAHRRARVEAALRLWNSQPIAWDPLGPGEAPPAHGALGPVLFATTVLAEGADVRADCVVLVGPVRSGILLAQALGRAARGPHPGTGIYLAPDALASRPRPAADAHPALAPAGKPTGADPPTHADVAADAAAAEWAGCAAHEAHEAVVAFANATRCRREALAAYLDRDSPRQECLRGDPDELMCDLCEQRWHRAHRTTTPPGAGPVRPSTATTEADHGYPDDMGDDADDWAQVASQCEPPPTPPTSATGTGSPSPVVAVHHSAPRKRPANGDAWAARSPTRVRLDTTNAVLPSVDAENPPGPSSSASRPLPHPTRASSQVSPSRPSRPPATIEEQLALYRTQTRIAHLYGSTAFCLFCRLVSPLDAPATVTAHISQHCQLIHQVGAGQAATTKVHVTLKDMLVWSRTGNSKYPKGCCFACCRPFPETPPKGSYRDPASYPHHLCKGNVYGTGGAYCQREGHVYEPMRGSQSKGPPVLIAAALFLLATHPPAETCRVLNVLAAPVRITRYFSPTPPQGESWWLDNDVLCFLGQEPNSGTPDHASTQWRALASRVGVLLSEKYPWRVTRAHLFVALMLPATATSVQVGR